MPSYSTLPDTLIVDGTDLMTLAGVVVENLDELFAPGRRRGDNDTIPRLPGQVGAEKVYDAFTMHIPVAVLPLDGAGVYGGRSRTVTNLLALGAAVKGTNGLVALSRKLAGGATHTARGEFVDGLQPVWPNFETAELTLQFVNLDGCWFNGTTVVVP